MDIFAKPPGQVMLATRTKTQVFSITTMLVLSITAVTASIGSIAYTAFSIASSPAPACAEIGGDCDGDGILNQSDNCIDRANSSQLDTNSDGYGNACDPDYDNNLMVGISDLGILRSCFGKNAATTPLCGPAGNQYPTIDVDLTGDGIVGAPDLAILRSYYGKAPGPSAVAPKLSVLLANSFDQAVVAGSENSLGVVTVTAQNAEVQIDSIEITITPTVEGIQGGVDEVVSLSVLKAVPPPYEFELLGSAEVLSNGHVLIPTQNFIIQAGEMVMLRIQATANTISDLSLAEAGAGFQARITDINAYKAGTNFEPEINVSNNTPVIVGQQWVYKSVPIVENVLLTNLLINGVNTIYKFSIHSNDSGPTGLWKFTFETTPSNVTLNQNGFYLYTSDSIGSIGELVAKSGDFTVINNGSGGLTLETSFDVGDDDSDPHPGEHHIVNAGTTKYYTLQATITDLDATLGNELVSTKLLTDSAFPGTVQMRALEVDATSQDNFIWSDLHLDQYTSTTATNSEMFYNGYLVVPSQVTQTVHDEQLSGVLNISTLPSPVSAQVVGGSTVTIGNFDVQAVTQDFNLNAFRFAIEGPDGGIGTHPTFPTGTWYKQVQVLSLYDGSTLLGSVAVNNTYATITPSIPISLAVNQTKTLTVKATMNNVGPNQVGISGGGFAGYLSNITASNPSSGNPPQTINGLGSHSATSTNFKSFHVFKSKPTVSQINTTNVLVNGINTLKKFQVTADTSGPVGLWKFTFAINTTGVSLATPGYYLYESDTLGSIGSILAQGQGSTVEGRQPYGGDFHVKYTQRGNDSFVQLNSFFDVGNDNDPRPGEHLIVNAGATKYFTLQGTTSDVDSTLGNEQIGVSVVNDIAFSTLASRTQGFPSSFTPDTKFIWSDLHLDLYASATATNAEMWFSGYRVSGLEINTGTPDIASDN